MSTLRRRVTIVNKLGLHARAAAKLVAEAGRFTAEVSLLKGTARVNAKSILGVMMLAAAKGSEVEIEAEGADAEEAVAALEALIARRFDEAE